MADGRTGVSRAGSKSRCTGGPWAEPVAGEPADGGCGGIGFVEGTLAFHPEHGLVDVLAVVGPQRLIRVQPGRSRSEIHVLAVHVDELSPVERGGATGLPGA